MAGQQARQARPPSAPAWLNAEARREYRRAGRLLAQMRVVKESDRTVLATYAQQYALYVEALEAMRVDGLVVLVDGRPVQNPYLVVANGALKQLRALLIELGMTPAARSRVQVGGEGERDEFDRFLDEKPGGGG